MGFEAKVMKIVDDVLGENEMNGFCSGTLFVCCFPEEADKLNVQLKKALPCKVQMTTMSRHMEYAYDFVA